MKIKNRKVVLRRIYVPLGDRSVSTIHVTDKQLARLNRVQVGKEIFLSNAHCQIGGDYWVIRTDDGLQYVPNPHFGTRDDIRLLESMFRSNDS